MSLTTSLPVFQIFSVPVHALSRMEVLALCRQWLQEMGQRQIVTVNPEMLLRARSMPWFREMISRADLRTADGIGLRWAGTFLHELETNTAGRRGVWVMFCKTFFAFLRHPHTIPSPLPERISGVDLVADITEVAAQSGVSVYLLGGKQRTALLAAEALKKTFPTLKVFAFLPEHTATSRVSTALHEDLERTAPGVLFIGYGVPMQEEWISHNLHRYPSIRIAMGVGGTLDMLAGNVPRAPHSYQIHGLEWLWRLAHQPRRILRTLRATLLFPTMLLLSQLRRNDPPQ